MNVDESITVAVSAYGNHRTTKHCLDLIINSLEGDFELILVDDCSPDNGEIFNLFVETSKKHKNTKIYRFQENLEYSGSLNCILSHANGEKVIFVSNDIFTSEAYFRCLIDVSNENKFLGIVRGVSNFVDNDKLTHNLDVSNVIRHLDEVDAFSKKLLMQKKSLFIEDDYLTGDAFLVTRDVISKIGTLDPLFFGYFADHDYGIRAQRAGFRLGLACGAFAYHHQDANFNYLPLDEKNKKLNARWSKVIENWARFKLKYGLPVSLAYTGINDIDWNSLNSLKNETSSFYIDHGNYSNFLCDGA